MAVFIGIDPGVSGAIGFIDDVTGDVWVEDMPTLVVPGPRFVNRRVDGSLLYDLLHAGADGRGGCAIFVEEVSVRPGTAMKRAQSETALVKSLGVIEAVCDILGSPAILVPPQQWQKFYGIVGKHTEERGPGELPKSVSVARTLYPGAAASLSRVQDHNRAEALLIARYGVRAGKVAA